MDSQEFKFALALSPEDLNRIVEQPQELWNLIPDKTKKMLREFVFDSLQNKDGSPELNDLEVKSFKYDAVKESGNFRLHFMVDRKFCCSDTDSCAPDYMDFTFQYQQGQMLAHAAYFDWTLNN